jgi:tRNA nucleotidyltransferase (CCA-adding enzyme)
MRLNKDKIPSGVFELTEIFNKNNKELYLVGGCVRDLIMGVEPHDFDLCTDATPSEMKEFLRSVGVYTWDSGDKFGTITAVINNTGYEITTYRKESGYSDSRHPDKVEFVTDIHEDLKRRDFTINAMAFNPVTDELIDDFDGQGAISEGIIDCVGNAYDRFEEDALRIMRALRFAVRYQSDIRFSTEEAMHNSVDKLNTVSKERITQELEKLLTCKKPVKQYLLKFSDIIVTILPDIKDCVGCEHNNKYHRHNIYEHILSVVDGCNTDNFVIKLAALLHDIGKPQSKTMDDEGWCHYYGHPEVSYEMSKELLKRDLRINNEQYNRTLQLIRYHDINIAYTKNAMKRALNKYGEEFLLDWFILKKSDQDDHVLPAGKQDFRMDMNELKHIMEEVIAENQCFKIKDMELTGNDVMEILNIKPGKRVGEVLNAIFEKVLNSEVENKHEELVKILETEYK